MPSARCRVEIDAPPARVMEVITDFPAYPRFLPEIEEAEVVSATPESWEVRFVLRLIRRMEYTLRLSRDEDRLLQWSLVAGIFRSNDGSWELEPMDGGARTRATYAIDLVMDVFIPRAIVNSLVGESLPATLARFKARAEGG
ncbi:MAG: SRPBCC family protein [Deltaproteobacteria bacterium]|nr:SRPBCC family protein [Deltaproteobacteria bacterium]